MWECDICNVGYCVLCHDHEGCPNCIFKRKLREMAGAIQEPTAVSPGTLTAIRAIAAHVTDSRLAMAAIRVLLEET